MLRIAGRKITIMLHCLLLKKKRDLDLVVFYTVSSYFIKIKLLRTPRAALPLTGLLAVICPPLRSQWAPFLRDFERVSSIIRANVAGVWSGAAYGAACGAATHRGRRRIAGRRSGRAQRGTGAPGSRHVGGSGQCRADPGRRGQERSSWVLLFWFCF